MTNRTSKILLIILSSLAVAIELRAAPPSSDDVGDAESFGHNAQFMGAASGFITLSPDCSTEPTPPPRPPTSSDQCFTLTAAPSQTNFNAQDICRLKLPKKATRTIIYPVLNFFHDYRYNNTTATRDNAIFRYTADITIESTVLNDPSIIDPNTGMPANGKLVMQFGDNNFRDQRAIDPAETAIGHLNYTHAGNLGITKPSLVEQGLPQNVVDDLFKSAMTIHLNISGAAKLISRGSIIGNMRLFGD